MDTRFEITREQYERFKAAPTPGFVVDMDCTYYLLPEAMTREYDASTPVPISGPYDKRRSPLSIIVINDSARLPSESSMLWRAAVAVDDILMANPQGVTSQDAATALSGVLEVDTATASRHITMLIHRRFLGFIAPY